VLCHGTKITLRPGRPGVNVRPPRGEGGRREEGKRRKKKTDGLHLNITESLPILATRFDCRDRHGERLKSKERRQKEEKRKKEKSGVILR